MANNSAYDIIRKFLSKNIKGKFTEALLKSIATGDEINKENVLAAKDQLFISTASGIFLDKLLAGLGITRPPGVGIDDALLKEIAIKQTNSKLVSNIFLDLLEVFYGEDAIRANILSGASEKYVLEDGMVLSLLVDTNKEPLDIVFKSEDFTNINLATAQEVAQAISNSAFAQNYTLTAVPEVNEDGLKYVRLFSGTKGPKSSISVIGGSAQNVLKFPTVSNAIPKAGTQLSMSINQQYVRFTWTGGPDPGINQLNVGDYVNIYGSQFLEINKGYFQIENVQGGGVGQAYFEIINPDFKLQPPVTLTSLNSSSGYGIARRTIPISDAPTGAVRVSNVTTITTPSPHGLQIGDVITIQNVLNTSFNGRFTIVNTPTSTTFTYSQTAPNALSGSGTIIREVVINPPITGAVRTSGTTTITTSAAHGFQNGHNIQILGVEDSTFNGTFPISGVTSNTFQYTQDMSNDLVFYRATRSTIQQLSRYTSVYEVNPYEVVIFIPATTKIVKRVLIGSAHIQDNSRVKEFLGPYIFDVKSGLPVTKTFSNLSAPINAGDIKSVIFLQNSSIFPDEQGFLFFDFGTDNEEGPVKYYGRPSSNSLLIDPSYRFKKDHSSGSDISLLTQVTPYKPKPDGTDYQAYLTDTVAGRIEAQKLINNLTASGIFVSIFIIYPQHKGVNNVENIVYAGDLDTLGL